MKQFKKILMLLLCTSFIMILSSCSFFSDKDLEINNKYNTKTTIETDLDGIYAQGVKGVETDKVANTLCFKNINYSENSVITNTYKTGGENENGFNVNGGNDYEATTSGNNYDLYVPNSASKTEKHVVILFIHGGAWVSGFKTDVNQYIYKFAEKGYIAATIKYTLLKREGEDTSLSIFRNLDEIDQCIKSIKKALIDLDFDTTKTELVVGGASSGAHLAMLYTYSRGDKSVLPIKFIIDAVGPVDLKEDSWKKFINPSEAVLSAGLGKDAIETQRTNGNLKELKVSGEDYYWNQYQTMRITLGFCGYPYPLSRAKETTDENEEEILYPNVASNSMTRVGGGEDLLSVTYWINSNKYPIICAYAGKDSIVGIAQYAKLEAKLLEYDIEHEYFYFKYNDHTEITEDEETYNNLINKIDEWCKKDTI